MGSISPIQILLVSYPAQGHINPLLRLAKCLAAKGFSAIFITTEKAGKNMQAASNITDNTFTPIGDGSLTFKFFDDGLSDDDRIGITIESFSNHLELAGRKFVSEMIKNHAETNKPISCIINNPFFPWVCEVAYEHDIPSVLSWIHSCAVFNIYYNYVHKIVPYPSQTEPYIDVQLNSSLVLKYHEIPEFLHPFCPFPYFATLTSKQFKDMSKVFCVLVDTYEELEHDFIDYISEKSIPMRTIGPLFRNPKAKEASNIRGDIFESDDCNIIEWLNTKPKDTVVYISFGSVVNFPQEQVNEFAYGLLDSKVSFLWALKNHVFPDGFLDETSERGKIVKWTPQEEVLAHPSLACYMTHCGWNSTMEAIALGVPVLAFPSLGDQLTNAKFLVDVFGIGIKLGFGGIENKLVTRDVVKKCLLEATTGEKAKELKKNAMKWKKKAEEAVAVGGSSDRNLDAFVEDIKKHVSLNIQKM